MSTADRGLVWYRQDLRTQWHSPLAYALQKHSRVTAVFALTLAQWQQYGWAKAKIDLILERLVCLQQELQTLGVDLHVLDIDDHRQLPQQLIEFAQHNCITTVYANAEYEWDERQRDRQVKQVCQQQGIHIGWFHDTCIVPPTKLMTGKGEPYKVFTPYFRQWHSAMSIRPPDKLQSAKKTASTFLPLNVAGHRQQSRIQLPAKTAVAEQQLDEFLQHKASAYKEQRDFPALSGTSGLSVYLVIGALAPAQCAYALQLQAAERLDDKQTGEHTWLKELAWRDFYRYLMFHFPHVAKNRCFTQHYDQLPWQANQQLFQAWCNGKTGFPIVDAAMRCLNATGWMHNRLRMVVASFLCKDLRLPWRWGEDYFLSQLIDGDFASNNGGWQWSASVGADAAPYFRVFNPVLQSQKYDPDGEFIRRWCSELAGLSNKYIHQPHAHTNVEQLNYPLPIVEHKTAAAEVKHMFQQHLEWVKSGAETEAETE